VHGARADDGKALEHFSHSFQEVVALRRMDGRGRRLNGGAFGV
jgi:hypothetical protein